MSALNRSAVEAMEVLRSTPRRTSPGTDCSPRPRNDGGVGDDRGFWVEAVPLLSESRKFAGRGIAPTARG